MDTKDKGKTIGDLGTEWQAKHEQIKAKRKTKAKVESKPEHVDNTKQVEKIESELRINAMRQERCMTDLRRDFNKLSKLDRRSKYLQKKLREVKS